MKVSVQGRHAILFACVFSATIVARADNFFSRMSGQDDSGAAAATYADIVPSFDIVNVKVLCKDKDGTYSATRFQPLISDESGVEAQIANIQMSPSNIQMYVTYYVGTNVWGADNWPFGQTVTKPMVPVPGNPLVYRTSPANDIPIQQKDQVVQYLVWASYLGGSPLFKRQETFDNPAWYFPVDLNQTFAAKGWSPYYIVYDVPLGAVWINEINATDYVISNGVQQVGIWDNQYIEIAVPAWLDLEGWSVDLVTLAGTRTITIPSGLPEQMAVTNGYAFFVIGDAAPSSIPGTPALPKMDYGYPGLTDSYYMPRMLPGGLRLRRPLGMYEQAIAYDWHPDYGEIFDGLLWASNDPEMRFVYVGNEKEGGSLGVKGITTTNWFFPQTWTPGWPNNGQTVPSAEVTMQGVESVASPVFAPGAGTTASNSLAVTITCATAGATIRYTLDGSAPTSESAVYTDAITLIQSATIKAKAFKTGLLSRATVMAPYTIITPKFDLVDVKVLCKDIGGTYSTTRVQPLASEEVGVEAKISNVQLTPSNIQMYVSYYIGTNVWGVDNWPSNQIITKPMYPTVDNPLVYRTSPTNDISAQWTDQVVQYRVWANYWGVVPLQTVQETFENPAWFYQVDLNQVFATQGWSPFYIVYGQSGNAAWPLDIVSIRSDQANATCTAPGTGIDVKFTLAGKFQLISASGGTFALLPEIRLIVNGGEVAYASLYSLSQYKVANGTEDRTDVIFRYTVQPGDMAQPLAIYGPPSVPYQFYWNGWEVRNVTTDAAAVWKFNIGLSLPSEGEVCDADLTGANITVRALSFDEVHSPNSLTAKTESTWRVTTGSPVAGGGIDFYVWTLGTNLLQIGTLPNQTALLMNIPAGATQADFPIKALGVGTTDIYLQRVRDYQNNSISGVTNAVRRTITLIAPPPPLVRVVMTDSGTDSISMNETSNLNTGSFQIELSEVFTNDVWVRIDTSPTGQSNVTFDTFPVVVRIPAGSLVSPVSRFSVPDGFSWMTSGSYYDYALVTLTPTVTNADAAATYTRIQNGTVYVHNVAPVILKPLATEMRNALRGVPFTFDWEVSDAPADLATVMTAWDFGDGQVQTVYGASGQIFHTFTSSGLRQVRVHARDKDQAYSNWLLFYVNVVQPTVRVVPSTGEYSETNNTGSLMVYLNTAFTDDVWVRLSSSVNGKAQSNLVLATDVILIPKGSTNAPAPISLSLLDGTYQSQFYGVDIVPTVTNASAAAIFTSLQQAKVYVDNVAPVITQPDDWGPLVPPYDRVVVGRPFTFFYTVKDAPADQESMKVYWNIDDQFVVATGAVGQVTHTFSRTGGGFVSLYAQDKDGGRSDYVDFFVKVIPVPPPPSVRVLTPSSALQETPSPNTGELTVQLSEAFTNAVTVGLAVTPANSAENGAFALATNQVVFEVGETQKTVKVSLFDGTGLSQTNGFTITPTVTGNAAAVAYYPVMTSGSVKITNVSPSILYPFASDLTGPTIYLVRQGEPWGFNWMVSDVALDAPTLSVLWDFGDGQTQRLSGGSGYVGHIYTVTGDRVVSMVASDKDGGQSEVQFKIRVAAPRSFAVWAANKGLSGDLSALFGLDRDGDGIVNGFEYAFGTNLTAGMPLLKIRIIDGSPLVETPKRDPDTTADVSVAVEGCTNLLSGGWLLPIGPSLRSGKPSDRDWYAPLVTVPDRAFFRLRAVRE